MESLVRVSGILIVLIIAGCGDGHAVKRMASVLFEGTLIVSDRPAGKAQLAFHPQNGGSHRPVATTDAEGHFRLTTFSAYDGAPAGEYIVTIFWENEAMPLDGCGCPDVTQHDRLFGLYYDPTKSTLRVTVSPDQSTMTISAHASGRSWNLPPRIERKRPTDSRE